MLLSLLRFKLWRLRIQVYYACDVYFFIMLAFRAYLGKFQLYRAYLANQLLVPAVVFFSCFICLLLQSHKPLLYVVYLVLHNRHLLACIVHGKIEAMPGMNNLLSNSHKQPVSVDNA